MLWRGFSVSGQVIMVVDDEPALRDLIAIELQSHGHTVLKANSGNRALQMLETQNVDLVLSDVVMRDGNGIDFRNKLCRTKTPPRFIFVTAWDLNEFLLQDTPLVRKPFNVVDLMAAVEEDQNIN
jgi:two-component system response regulator VanR